jgi:hypothetical protein
MLEKRHYAVKPIDLSELLRKALRDNPRASESTAPILSSREQRERTWVDFTCLKDRMITRLMDDVRLNGKP